MASASLSYLEIHSVNKALDIFTYAGWVESRWTHLMPPLHGTITYKQVGQVDTFNASPPYHQIKTIHRPCKNICTYTCIHTSKRRLGLCARCCQGGWCLGLVAINTATVLASTPMHAEAPVPPPTLAYISMCHPLLHRTPPSPLSVSMCPPCSSYMRNR